MLNKIITATLATILLGCQTIGKDSGQVVFGLTDDRHEWYEIDNETVFNNSQAIVSLWNEWKVVEQRDGTFRLYTSTFGKLFDMCEGTKYYDEPAGCFCSGFLVDDDIVVTAGHCVEQFVNNPDSIVFVFDYKMISNGVANTNVNSDNVYWGKEIVDWKLDNRGDDYAIVRLDRPVVGRVPVELSDDDVKWREKVHMLGHPSGLPLKYTDNSRVTKNSPKEYFEADLDAFGGNSGSAVFNEEGEVVGILVRGWSDFKYNSRRGCNEIRTVFDTSETEEIIRTSRWSDEIPLD